MFQPNQTEAATRRTFCERIKTLLSTLARLLPDDVATLIAPPSERLMPGADIVLKNGFSADATVLIGLSILTNTLAKAMLARLSADRLEAAGYTSNSAVK